MIVVAPPPDSPLDGVLSKLLELAGLGRSTLAMSTSGAGRERSIATRLTSPREEGGWLVDHAWRLCGLPPRAESESAAGLRAEESAASTGEEGSTGEERFAECWGGLRIEVEVWREGGPLGRLGGEEGIGV